ncbi:MAG: CoA transferase, partial [Actinomycetota bacterium]
MLQGWRVLDLTDHRGEIGPYVLADLGAEVTKLVPAGHDATDGNGDDLAFAVYNANKRVTSLDPDPGQARAAVLAAAAGCDVVFDSWPGGRLDGLGITN